MINTPFFILNPKSYLYGESLLNLAQVADELATEVDFTIFVTAPFSDIRLISENTKNIFVTAQHMNGMKPGRGMGHVLPEAIKEAGAKATFLNHAENPMTLSELTIAVVRAKELGIFTIVCADTIDEAKSVAMLSPDIILCEPTELIGTGKTSDDSYIEKTNAAIKSVNNNILVMQAAGISTAFDVYRTISLGADGTGCTSGIVAADSPEDMLRDMIKSIQKAKENRR